MAKINLKLLKEIADATASGGFVYVSTKDGEPLLADSLIIVNPAVVENGKTAAKVTDAGVAYLASKPVADASAPSPYVVQKGFAPPPSKRGGGGAGAPTVYPFETMEIGDSFFVPISEKHPDPVKQLGSTVSAANQRYAEDTGETKTVKRAKRGDDNKAIKGEDGKNVMEEAVLPVKKATRKFIIRKVEANVKYGDYTAPGNGAVIARVALD